MSIGKDPPFLFYNKFSQLRFLFLQFNCHVTICSTKDISAHTNNKMTPTSMPQLQQHTETLSTSAGKYSPLFPFYIEFSQQIFLFIQFNCYTSNSCPLQGILHNSAPILNLVLSPTSFSHQHSPHTNTAPMPKLVLLPTSSSCQCQQP